ncbi:MAG TPA: hypothetical protein VN628_08835 [Vicinamibacterales bacterium]|nr:hypothetical protein [Vicinamibacterales bacterium]
MSASPSLLAAGTTLAEWARERRRIWSDTPLDISAHAVAIVEPEVEVVQAFRPADDVVDDEAVPEVFTPPFEIEEEIPAAEAVALVPVEDVIERPSAFITGLKACTTSVVAFADSAVRVAVPVVGELCIAIVNHVYALRGAALRWLVRGAVLASIAALVYVAALNRGQLESRWDHVAEAAVTAANRPPMTRPQPVVLPAGIGRVTINSSTAATVTVDGTARGAAPVTLDLPAGAHRMLLRSPDGSVDRAFRVTAGEITEVNEGIFPGWVALTTPIDVTLSEKGQPLKRDERGWAILAPGPHEIHLDNAALGVHEVRKVVVTPGDTTRMSFAPHTSTMSLTTNELADVWIDGTSYGQAPLVDQPIAIGVHDVRLRSAAHERWLRVRATTQPVTVNVDMTAN